MQRWLSIGLAVATLGVTSLAQANGRFPQAQQLIEDPTDPDRLVLRATFGILYTEDRGQTWRLVCEDVVGYSGTEDPSMGILSSGRVVAGIFAGLASTTDNGCTWDFAGGGLADRFVVDLTVDKTNAQNAIAMVSMGMGGGMFINQNYETSDDGDTWSQVGPDIDPTFLGLTIDPAPSDPQRLYMTGLADIMDGVLLRSTDRGQNFEEVPIAGTDSQSAPFIGAVHPTNPDILFVRTSGNVQVDNKIRADDALLFSDDGGTTFTEVLRGEAKMLGFALSPDGSEVLVGFGDPRDGTEVDETILGIWKSPVPAFDFRQIFPGGINCLAWTSTGVYACTAQFTHGFELGFSATADFTAADTDFNAEGKIPAGGKSALAPLLMLSEVEGIVDCAQGTPAGETCPATWPDTCELIGKCVGDGGVDPMDSGTPDGSTGAGGSAGSSAGDGDGGSCGCRAPGAAGTTAAGLSAWLLVLVMARRRRRR